MPKLNYINSLHLLEKLMPLSLALFFVRTIFLGYKYLFFVALVPCLLYSVYVFFKQGIVRPKLKTLFLPVLVIVLFFAHFLPLSNVVKESLNILLIVYFISFSNLYYKDDKCVELLSWIVRLSIFAGCLAIVRLTLSLMGVLMPLSTILFEGEGYSLVNDNNFYSLFFIILIILSAKLFANGQIKKLEYQIVNTVSAINIIAGLSRRAYVLYALVIAAMFVCVVLKRYDFKKSLLYNVLTICIISVVGGVMFFLSSGYYSPEMPFDKKYRYYKMYSLADNTMSYSEFDIKQQRKYYTEHTSSDTSNLFFNGDLQQYGLTSWRAYRSPHDCIKFDLVEDEVGDSVIRVTRGCSSGYWQVHYKGRPIVYHKGVTYKMSFAYRVIEGPENPFCVGWWVNEGQCWSYNLPRTIEPIDSVWKHCTVAYKFQEDRMNPHCFLNHLRAGSTIEVKDIRMTCDDTTGLPRYVDQLPDSVIHKYYSQDTINYFMASRTDRWRYALELWQTRYDTKQKIFGQGFKYLKWYGEKFYGNPDRHDFPHNPIISSFLYSGIVGGVVYIIFLIMSLWLYWKKRQQLGIFFIMYLCCMFFCMFSGSSHFSFPLFAFLSFLPFVEYKNDSKSEKIKNQNNI